MGSLIELWLCWTEGLSKLSEAGRWGFPFKDLARRKFQTALTIISLGVCISVTVFLVSFGDNIGVKIISITERGQIIGFSGVFLRFIFMVVILNSVAGIMVAYFLMTVSTSDRVRDIGIMKAVGCLTDVVFGYFSTELAVIVFAGCLLGITGGILLNFASIGLMNVLGFSFTMNFSNPLLIILIVFSFAFSFYILGMRKIVSSTRIEPAKALSPLFSLKTVRPSGSGFPLSFGKGFIAKVASRDLSRRRSMTLQIVACLSAIMVLTTLAVVGGVVANETMQSYVERAVGREVLLIAETRMAEHYESLLRTYVGDSATDKVSYLDGEYVIPVRVIEEITAIEGVVKVDPRLILEATVNEYPYIQPDPDKPGQYIETGGYRSTTALIVGVQPQRIVSDWLILGERISAANPDAALVGDTLALTMFQNPWLQTFRTLNSQFKVAGLCLDPLNNGLVVYVPFDRLSSITQHDAYNILLVQVDPSYPLSRSRVLSDIEAIISGTGLTVRDLSVAVDGQKAFLNHLWSLLLSLSLFCFVNAVSSLAGYLMLSMSSQQRDLGIMRALGAKPRTITGLALFETALLVLVSGMIGLPIGTVIVFWFFIPEAVVSQRAILTAAGLLSGLLCALCLTSLYPARRIVRTPITRAMSQT